MKSRIKTQRPGGRMPSTGSDRLFKALIIILAIILVILLMILAYGLRQSHYVYTSSPNELLMSIRNSRYDTALTDMKYNIANGETVSKNADYALPYALLDYYEAESLYVGYSKAAANATDEAEKADLNEKASAYLAQMEDARSRAGELEFMTEDIDIVFN